MKKLLIGTILAAMLVGQSVKAGDREWAVVGKVLTGVAVVHVVDHIVNPRPQVVYVQQPVVVAQSAPVVVAQPTQVVVAQPQVVYVQQPVVYYPAPVVVRYGHYHHRHGWCR